MTSTWRKRRQRRGAAFAEAVVALALFTILFWSLLYMYQSYMAKLAVTRAPRPVAWTSAIKACRGGASSRDAQLVGAGGDGSLGPIAPDLVDALRVARGTTLTTPLRTNLQVTAAVAQKSTGGRGDFRGLSMTARSTVICNELQAPISEGDVRATIWSFYGEFF